MSVLDFLRKAKNRVVEEVDLMITEAERNTPNLHEFKERNYIEHELRPEDLQRGDHVIAIEFFAHDTSEKDLIGRSCHEGVIEDVNVKQQYARMRITGASAVGNVPFHLVRFFETPAA